MQHLESVYHEGNLTPLLGAGAAGSLATTFDPFSVSAPTSQSNAVILYASVLQSIGKEALPAERLADLCTKCWQSTHIWTDDLVRSAAFRILALCANKKAESTPYSFLAVSVLLTCVHQISATSFPASAVRLLLTPFQCNAWHGLREAS